MRYLFCFICGAVSGVLGGMGMGGGTLLIPALIIFFKTSSKTAAAINLISFIPTAAVSLYFHHKNGLIKWRGLFWIIFPAILSGAIAYFVSRAVSGDILSRLFGAFLVLLAVVSFASSWRKKREKN